MKKTLLLIGLFAVLVGAGTYARRIGQSEVLRDECVKAGGTFDAPTTTCTLPDVDLGGVPAPAPADSATTTTGTPDSEDIAVDPVEFVDADSSLYPALIVSGEARGFWYFEASFPIELRVGTTTLTTAIATADGDWMTEDFVPFSTTIQYDESYSGRTATLILRKDNPSGLPEHDASVEIEVELE